MARKDSSPGCRPPFGRGPTATVAGGRQIPRLLLGAVVRLLEPKKVVVAVRRRAAESDPNRHLRLAVAATSPEGCMPLGADIPIGHGEIGYAAEVQRAMDRRDFENQPPPTRKRRRHQRQRRWRRPSRRVRRPRPAPRT